MTTSTAISGSGLCRLVRMARLAMLAFAALVLSACGSQMAENGATASTACPDEFPRQLRLNLVNMNSPRGMPAQLDIMGRQRLKLMSVQPVARVQISQGWPANQQQDGGLLGGIIAPAPEQHDLMPGEALTTNGTWVEVTATDATVRPTPHQLVFCLGLPAD